MCFAVTDSASPVVTASQVLAGRLVEWRANAAASDNKPKNFIMRDEGLGAATSHSLVPRSD